MTDSTMTTNSPVPPADSPSVSVNQAVAEGGAYEVLRRRLSAQGARVQAIAASLNAARLTEFGDSKLALLGRARILTEHNAMGRDIVQVDDLLLFGFNVQQGVKSQVQVADVFGLYRLVGLPDGSYDVQPLDLAGTFLSDAAFVRDFDELYAYYKDARLLQIDVKDGRLLAAFQIGERMSDMRVFRWSISSDGSLSYIDMRGERDIALPSPFDFQWVKAGRDREVSGRFPHLNILDTLFIDTSHGDLTVKLENNTETSEGIYAEPVEEGTQSLDDAQFEFARVGSLILLKVLPYREKQWRGLVFNTITQRVTRVDAIVQACVQLPEDHGIIFPGGYYLQNGEHKAFDAAMDGMQFMRAIRSPNGEDVLYLFYEYQEGLSALFVYNMIARQVQPPVFAHGHALMDDGRMVLFYAESHDPTRVHQMQVWQTPFFSEEFAASRPPSTSYLGKLGNAELVRGISNLYDLAREIENPDVSASRYQLLTHQTRRLFEAHVWMDDEHTDGLNTLLHEITATGESVLDEFEKVESLRREASTIMDTARADQRKLLGSLQPDAWTKVQEFVDALNALTVQRGKLLTARERRYIDTAVLDTMSQEVQDAYTRIGEATGQFLGGDKALLPFDERLKTLEAQAEQATTAKAIAEQVQHMGVMGQELDLLSELMTGLKVDDATQRTRVVEAISNIYARLNQARARAKQKRKSLASGEVVAQFGAQFSLFTQSITSALGLASTPEKADEGLARLMVQLEELEGQFGEHEQFLADILAKREELVETFETHKQALLDERQRRAQSVQDAANRILDGLAKRTERMNSPEELHAFFSGDPLILKLRELATRLRDLKDTVRADDLEARLKATRDKAVRVLRDRTELFEEGGNVIKLGPRHRFSVNTQPLDLTLLPRGDQLAIHLTGTEFMQPLHDPVLNELKAFWPVTLDSESPDVSRAEYLAGELLNAAQENRDGLSMDTLAALTRNADDLTAKVRDFAAPRYREGYEKGIHDHDAALILQALIPLLSRAGTLIYPPDARAKAIQYWATHPDQHEEWQARIASAHAMQQLFQTSTAVEEVTRELAREIERFAAELPPHPSVASLLPPSPTSGEGKNHRPDSPLPSWDSQSRAAERGGGPQGRGGEGATEPTSLASAEYLVEELRVSQPKFAFTKSASDLLSALRSRLSASDMLDGFNESLARLGGDVSARWNLVVGWLSALTTTSEFAESGRYVPEAAALALYGEVLPHEVRNVSLNAKVDGLLGEHARVRGGSLSFAVDDELSRLERHREAFVPAFHRYQGARQQVIAREREALRLSEFQARPLTSFVRNRLINDIYLPLIGDNLAKQMGTVGENKRSDLMGLLMLISPPGYGKTTLMEYVANRLGLVFMKINGPSLGHGVKSLDPAQAPDATSRQELEKVNLALEMGNNVMLYVDDIQHTHPEFLQKFISLTDGTRRIEGVWQGKTKTYDLRGRKFAVVMAGNPYTESGEVFKIPDMLANRADIYNLGDVLGGMEDAFKLSYIENSLTSNPVLSPLATRDLSDLYLLVDRALGKDVSTNNLTHQYSAAEINEITATLERLLTVREVVYRVNQEYIASAAQDDKYRTEPPFKLQGSYRNMNKLAEKISPVMNVPELQQLVSDHYQGEAQLLTTGAEENLLKLAELRGTLTPEQAARWAQIKADYLRNKRMGGEEGETGARVVAQLADIASGLQSLGQVRREPQPVSMQAAPQPLELAEDLRPLIEGFTGSIQQLETARQARDAAQVEALTAALKHSLGLIAQATERPQPPASAPVAPPAPSPAEQQLSILPETLEATISPLLLSIAASSQRQDELNTAVNRLVNLLEERQAVILERARHSG